LKHYQPYRPFEKFFKEAENEEKDSLKKEIFLKWKEQKRLKNLKQ
jgi:hypothetical protein